MTTRCITTVLAGIFTLCLSSPTLAGNGPWVLSTGDFSGYSEVQYQQWQRISDENGDQNSIGNRSFLTRFHAIASYGIAPRVDAELKIGVASSTTSDPNTGACGALSCKPLFGLVPIEARLKWQLLDEWAGSPFSLAVSGTTRMGSFASNDRHRLTSFSEGTVDVGGLLSFGFTRPIGQVQNWFWLDVQYRHRIPNAVPGGENPETNERFSIPGPELVIQGDWMMQPNASVSFGPAWDFLYRTKGTSLSELDPMNRDAVASLAARSLKLGLKLDLRNERFNTISLGVFHTVFAQNNPADLLFISIGFSRFVPKKIE